MKSNMKTKEKIDIIYKEIANKELSFWCRFIWNHNKWFNIILFEINKRITDLAWDIYYIDWDDSDRFKVKKIIGHPVLFGDLFNYFQIDNRLELTPMFWWLNWPIEWESNYMKKQNIQYQIISLWSNKRLAIEEQSEECIDFIFNLITKWLI